MFSGANTNQSYVPTGERESNYETGAQLFLIFFNKVDNRVSFPGHMRMVIDAISRGLIHGSSEMPSAKEKCNDIDLISLETRLCLLESAT